MSGFALWFLVFHFHVFVSCLVVSYVLIFHALMCPLSVSYVLPSVCQCSQPCIPLVISPVGPPHLFLVCSSVSVYLVSVFPSLLVGHCILSVCSLDGFVCPCSSCLCSCRFPVPSGMRFWILNFAFCL